jgi:RimJ/RimL family protein N-acetyltransferase
MRLHDATLAGPRVSLRRATPEDLDAEDISGAALAHRLGVHPPPAWPPENNGPEVRAWFRADMAAHPDKTGWWCWYIVAHAVELDVLVGSAGFRGAPDASGTVEIGYAVLAPFQRHGYAAAAVDLLIAAAFTEPDVAAIVAHTGPDAAASQALLRRCGFVRDGEAVDPEDGPVWRWRRARLAPAPAAC